MSKSWASHEQVMNKSWTSHEQVMNKSWTSDEQVMNKWWTSYWQVKTTNLWLSHGLAMNQSRLLNYEQAIKKSWRSHKQVMNKLIKKSWKSHEHVMKSWRRNEEGMKNWWTSYWQVKLFPQSRKLVRCPPLPVMFLRVVSPFWLQFCVCAKLGSVLDFKISWESGKIQPACKDCFFWGRFACAVQ